MAIPEAQLETWTRQGSVVQSRDTYRIIKEALQSSHAPYAGRDYDCFLQGSYGNDTNVYGVDSDVDIVIRLTSTFYHDASNLTSSEQELCEKTHGGGSYGVDEFRNDVVDWLNEEFPSGAHPGRKAISITRNGARRDADVLPCATFRRYYGFRGRSDYNCAEGICFFLPDGTRVENFPRDHRDNCTTKQQRTGQRFKPMVRLLKNMRNRMQDEGLIKQGDAPSYFLEGLLYNIPNDKFRGAHGDIFCNSINWTLETDRSSFVCANGRFKLVYDTTTPETWLSSKCSDFLSALVDFWNNY